MFDLESSVDKEEILDFAKSLNVNVDARFSVDKIKGMLREAIRTDNLISEEELRSSRKVKVMIHKTEGDTGSLDVPVSVNGKTWLIKRGVEVVVPAYVMEVLQNAVKEIYAQDDVSHSIIMREVPAYPFSVTEI